jgi:hypothetical protein
MYDFTNYQIADIPIFMWSMVGLTTVLVGYVTVTSAPSVAAAIMPSPAAPTQMGGRTRRNQKKKGK